MIVARAFHPSGLKRILTMIKSLTAKPASVISSLLPPVSLFLCLQGSMVNAQPDREVSQLLFEPVPLALAESNPALALTSYSAAESEIPVAASELPSYTDAELDQMQEDIKRYLVKVGDM